MAEIIFPLSSEPSINPGENGGRLINAYAEKAPEGSRSKFLYRRAPGLDAAFTAGSGVPRGALLVGSILYIANGTKVYSVTKAGSVYTVQELSGTLDGTGDVTMAHNMRAPTNQILIQHSAGMAQIASGTVSSFSDSDLPSSLMITYQDGYFFLPTAAGRVSASDLNDDEFNANSFVTAESSPDGMVRCVPHGRDMLFMGVKSTEVWTNQGASPFPYGRVTVIPVGLFGINAVTGHELGFSGPRVFVSNDCIVFKLSGYNLERVSTPHIERLLSAVTDRSTVRMSCFTVAGHHFITMSSPDWSMVLDVSTGFWHERMSYGSTRWRVAFAINAFDEWLALDASSGAVYRINDRNFREATHPLVWEVRSQQMHGFPARTAINRASFDFITGVGIDLGIYPIETNPRVSISWSNDGGRTFGNALLRDLGTQGEHRTIDIWRTGLTGREGRQYKLQISDPIEVSMLGGSHFGESRL